MKKIKVFTKGQIAVFVMVLALCGAVWLNVKYSGNQKFLGDTTFVSNSEKTQKTVETSAKAEKTEEDYFTSAIKSREEAYEKIEESAEEILKGANISEQEKESALQSVKIISNRIATEQNIESLLKAKGFKKAVAVLSDKSADIVVLSDGLQTKQTMQIQDIITEQTDIPLSAIKIISIK